jgi:hypothetical protein
MVGSKLGWPNNFFHAPPPPPGVTIPATVPQKSEFPEGLLNYPVYFFKKMFSFYKKKSKYFGDKIKSVEQQKSYGYSKNVIVMLLPCYSQFSPT